MKLWHLLWFSGERDLENKRNYEKPNHFLFLDISIGLIGKVTSTKNNENYYTGVKPAWLAIVWVYN